MKHRMIRMIEQLKGTQNGFALVTALSLMAFVLLLLMSITTLVQVEVQSSEQNMSRIQAQQNALLGLQQALGALQAAAGPDQRATVTSEMFDSDAATPEIEDVQARHYTGVFHSYNNDTPLESFRDTQNEAHEAITWLASAEDPIADPVKDPLSKYSSELIEIAHIYQEDTKTVEPVLAGKIQVDEQQSGAFAWWVADEGMKAKFNTEGDQMPANSQVDGPLELDSLRIMQAAGSNFSHISEGFQRPFSELESGGHLGKLSHLNDLKLLGAEWGEWALPKTPANPTKRATINPDVTLYSRGLPIDITHGRLKEDLTVYLETGEGLTDDTHIIRGSSTDLNYTGPPLGATLTNDPLTDNLPRFGLLRSWHDLGKAIDAGKSKAQAHTNTQHGLHPNIMRAGISFTVALRGPAVIDPGDNSKMITKFQILINPRVAIHNPYNFKLPADKYLFELSIPDKLYLNWQLQSDGALFPPVLDASNSHNWHELANFSAGTTDNGTISAVLVSKGDSSYAWQKDRAWVRMTIDTSKTDGIAAGETLNFAPEISQYPLQDSIYVDQAAIDFRSTSDVNVCDNVNEANNLENVWALGDPIAVSIPVMNGDSTRGSGFWFNPEDETSPPPPQYRVCLRYELINYQGLNGSLSWRLSLLGAGPPTLLSSKDPHKTEGGYTFGLNNSGFDYTQEGQSHSDWSLAEVKSFENTSSPPSHHSNLMQVAMHDYSTTTAVRGGHGQGGDRRNAISNPHGGILRESLTAADWTARVQHQTMHRLEILEKFWDPAMWPRKTELSTGNESSVEGYVHSTAGNAQDSTGCIYTMFDFPRRYGPITSLGQLQHAGLNSFCYGPAYQVGYSRAPYFLDRDQTRYVPTPKENVPNEFIDVPYMVNSSLWDRFYLSTIPQTASLDLNQSQEYTLANARHILTPDRFGKYPPQNELRNSEIGFQQSAGSIQVDGAFNVNSVSVNAWEALLLQAAGKTLETENDGTLNSAAESTFVAFPRFPDPVYGVENGDEFAKLDAQDAKQHAGVFVTDRADIRLLAENIVAEIKRRGPFLSLADFINRRLIPNTSDLDLDYQGLMGTMDAAIMRASQIEDVLNYPQIFSRTGNGGQQLDPDYSYSWDLNEPTYAVSPEAAYGIPSGHKSTALEGSSANLMQGDILQFLGPQLTARSDTFVIRCYGESIDPISKKVQSAVRGEAIVQRIAEPVAPGDNLIAPSGAMGRRFIIRHFRWIDPQS